MTDPLVAFAESLRREAQVLADRPELTFVIEPGAVGTPAAAPGPSDPTGKGGWLRRLTRRSGAG